MPGRRVSRHSKANTFPATVALPIFRSSIFMGTGLVLMGLPIRTFPEGLPLPFPLGAEDEDAGAAPLAAGCSTQVTSNSALVKPYTAHKLWRICSSSSGERGIRTRRCTVMVMAV